VAAGELERVESLAAGQGLRAKLLAGSTEHYRGRARLAVRGRVGRVKVGIFAAGSHDLVDIPRCAAHHPLINQVAGQLRRAMTVTRTPPYSDDAHAGLVRYLQVVVERSTQTAQVVLVINSPHVEAGLELAAELHRLLESQLHSLWVNGQPEHSNAILGTHWFQVFGPTAVRETIGGAQVCFLPGAFGQNNLDLYDRVVQLVHDWIPADTVVAEYYCGSGALGLGLLRKGCQLRFNELGAHSLAGLELGLKALPAELRARASVVAGAAVQALSLASGAHTVIVDPPRKGLDRPLLDRLIVHPPQQLVYLSCSFDSFLRDARFLLQAGRWRMAEVAVAAMFPFTRHFETIARFKTAGA
jgi:23S rRNA (uracil1939-C5)-methyltransferase